MSARRRAPLIACLLAGALVWAAAAAGARRAGAPGPALAAAGAPAVQAMIVGRGGAVIYPARTISARAVSLRIRGRSCAVAAATPLAALAAARRAGAPPFAVRDYGHCGSSAANSGQLFVYSVAGEGNSGQDGWEYKVNDVSGATGAGDPSGPMGDGRRLRGGARVLWFWCEAGAGGCQRTLAVTPARATVAAGAPLAATVTGYDEEGRPAPVAGAIVTLGGDFASTDAHGRATLIAPSGAGAYPMSATRGGLVPSFPATVLVR